MTRCPRLVVIFYLKISHFSSKTLFGKEECDIIELKL